MKVAFLFPGQGAQYVGMGKELYEQYIITRQVFEKANTLLDWNVEEVCFQDSNGLINETRYTQAALFTTNYGIYRALTEEGIQPEAVLGFSLGEYDAIAASGALKFQEVLKLVDERAILMEECANKYPGGMYAVIGMTTDKVAEICQMVSDKIGSCVTVANDNCEGQVTIAGTKKALEVATISLKEAGAKRVVPLNVSGAFHSPLMSEAADRLKEKLEGLSFNKTQIPIISNVTALPVSGEEIRENIPLQVIKGVRFRESILYLLEQGFDTFIEVGPKTTLNNLVKKMTKDVALYHVEDCASLSEVLEKVGRKSCLKEK